MKIALDFLEQFIVKNGIGGTCLNGGRGRVYHKWCHAMTPVILSQILRYFPAFHVAILVKYPALIGFLRSTFDIYWSLALQFSYILKGLSEGSALASNKFQQQMKFCSALCRSVTSSFGLLSVLGDYGWEELSGNEVAHIKTTWFTIFDPTFTYILTPKGSNKAFLKYHFNF